MILTTILSATTLTGFGLAWITYCRMRNAESLARQWEEMCETAFNRTNAFRKEANAVKQRLAVIDAQRKAAGRKGGLATAAKRAEVREVDVRAAWYDAYPAALDAERFAQTLDRLDREFPA